MNLESNIIGGDTLPNSRPKTSRNAVQRADGGFDVPIWCASCHVVHGGWVHEQGSDFAFYLCVDCDKKYGAVAGLMRVPDEQMWAILKQEQIDRYGRELSGLEVEEALKDEHHWITKLARDRSSFEKG